jgi:hypothetical protein
MHFRAIIFLILISISVMAQNPYAGGSGKGSCVFYASASSLSGSPINIYYGGRGSGDFRNIKDNFFISGEEVKFYFGSAGRGEMSNSFSSYMNGEPYKIAYAGGNGKGDYMKTISESYLNGSLYTITSNGGKGKGDNCLSFSSYLTGESISISYKGGIGRGDIKNYSQQQYLNGVDANIAYYGGQGRGDKAANKSSQMQEGDVSLNLKLFIEGFYTGGGQMRAVIDALNFPSLCDAVSVELYDPVFPYNMAYNTSIFLDVNGNVNVVFPAEIRNHSYYIVLNHRNTIETWSATAVNFGSTLVNYTFSDNIHKAFGDNMRNLGDGNYAFWSGDIPDLQNGFAQDGIVEAQDYNAVGNASQNFLTGYIVQDLTGDGVVESEDYSIIENNMAAIISKHRP